MSTARKVDHNGLTRYERQRLAFIAGVLQAVQEQQGPIGHWCFRGSGAMSEYARGLDRGRDAVRVLLERYDY